MRRLLKKRKDPPVSEVYVTTGTADETGSTNTKIRIFGTLVTQVGPDISRTTSTAAGDSFVINSRGLYAVTYTDGAGTAEYMGLSKNSPNLTTGIADATNNAYRLAIANIAAGEFVSIHTTVRCEAGDIIRAHGDVTNKPDQQSALVALRIVKVG